MKSHQYVQFFIFSHFSTTNYRFYIITYRSSNVTFTEVNKLVNNYYTRAGQYYTSNYILKLKSIVGFASLFKIFSVFYLTKIAG